MIKDVHEKTSGYWLVRGNIFANHRQTQNSQSWSPTDLQIYLSTLNRGCQRQPILIKYFSSIQFLFWPNNKLGLSFYGLFNRISGIFEAFRIFERVGGICTGISSGKEFYVCVSKILRYLKQPWECLKHFWFL